MRRRLVTIPAALAMAVVVALGTAAPASACGGLVGENGTIRLQRTTTLAGYHDGVEHYITSFSFTGEGQEVGSIIPLPGIPTVVERAGDWTLQRLEREVAPPFPAAADAGLALSSARDSAQVILQTKIDALDITILKGGGTEVGTWATSHGFLLTPDAPQVLDEYSQRSPIFMAARFDAQAAKARGQNAGDGTPIHLAIPTPRPWVPLRILGLGLQPTEAVNADVFLLTDTQPKLLAGNSGLQLERSEPASKSLLNDLRSDKNSKWVPFSSWLTFLRVDASAGELHYDLATSLDGAAPSLVDAGIAPPGAPTPRVFERQPDASWGEVVSVTAIVLVTVVGLALVARRRVNRSRATS